MSERSPTLEPSSFPPALPRIALSAGLVALGDFLLFDREPGVSLILFLLALAGAALAARPGGVARRSLPLAGAGLAAGLLPLAEALNPLSFLFAVAGTALCVALSVEPAGSFRAALGAAAGLVLRGPFQIAYDGPAGIRWAQTQGVQTQALRRLLSWIVPLALTAVFAMLFAAANPLIEAWLVWLAPSGELQPGRVVVWAILFALAWAFVAYRRRAWPSLPAAGAGAEADGRPRLIGGAMLRQSLILFNLVFAVETVLDLLYLWGGAALPEGMTYAAYAHRGAYPLIVTALLAAGFVLVAMGPGAPGERSPLIRALVFLWIGQNVFLVLSAILRLDLYVEVYSLTMLRVAAFIWMGLVAAGLVLIVARIALRRSNGWLVGANALVLTATLYACCFADMPRLVADFNLAHSQETGGGPLPFDAGYARQLGPAALPALDRYLALRAGAVPALQTARDDLARRHRERMGDWRSWTFRGWRLLRYLDGPGRAAEAKNQDRLPTPSSSSKLAVAR